MGIRKTRDSDIRDVSMLHKEHINSGFLSSLWTPFLSMLYRSLVDFGKGILLVAENEGKVIGFVSGTIKTGEFYKSKYDITSKDSKFTICKENY